MTTHEEKLKAVYDAIEVVRPEAKELLELAKQDVTTKDGYGVILRFVTSLPSVNMQLIFLAACQVEGYPVQTLDQVRQIMGF